MQCWRLNLDYVTPVTATGVCSARRGSHCLLWSIPSVWKVQQRAEKSRMSTNIVLVQQIQSPVGGGHSENNNTKCNKHNKKMYIMNTNHQFLPETNKLHNRPRCANQRVASHIFSVTISKKLKPGHKIFSPNCIIRVWRWVECGINNFNITKVSC